jgi:hypothetical protein
MNKLEILKNQINKWSKNKRITNHKDINLLHEYIKEYIKEKINNSDELHNKIYISSDYEFEYYNDNFEKIRNENIVKLNCYLICKRLADYFPEINIECKFETHSIIDSMLKEKGTTFKHDVYILINNKKNDKKYECVIEYFEKNHKYTIPKDTDKQIYTRQIVDNYIVYKEESNNINEFYKFLIHKLLLSICASLKDHYILSKVNFFKNNKNNLKKLKKQTENFNKILKYHKNKKFNFEELFIELIPINLQTGEKFTMDEFIEFLEENYNISIIFDKNGYCDYSIFVKIIMKLVNHSDKIDDYQDIFVDTIEILTQSSIEIMEYIDEINQNKSNLPIFMQNFLQNHIHKYINKDTLKNVYEKIKSNFKNLKLFF